MSLTRRSVLLGAGALGLRVAGAREVSVAASDGGSTKRKVLIAGGHPGDPEYGCGGLAATLTAHGHEVVLLYLNDGAWPPTPAEVRLKEAKTACEALKARPLYADQKNGAAIVDAAHYESFGHLIEAEKPDALFTHWPMDHHRDHRAAAQLCLDAWLKQEKRFSLYYYEVSDGEDTIQFRPDRYVDIGAVENRKKAACYAHASQTPDRYYALQTEVARFRGLESGCTLAEGYLLQGPGVRDALADVWL